MRSRFSRPRILNAQNSYAAYLAVSALLDVLLDSEVACLETTCLDFLGIHLDGHPLRFQNIFHLGVLYSNYGMSLMLELMKASITFQERAQVLITKAD